MILNGESITTSKTTTRTKKKMEEEEEPLSPMARIYQLQITNYCIVNIIGCKTKIDPQIILHSLKHNVSNHFRFSSKLSDDGARWIKTEVNVEDHVFVPDIDDAEDIGEEDGQSFVDEYISHLTTVPLDRSKPLWDIHILNVKTSDAEATCVVRSHHSLGDAMSLMSLLVAFTRKTSDPEVCPTIPAVKRREKVSYNGLRGRNNYNGWFSRSLFAFWSTVRFIWNTVVDLLLLSATILFVKDTKTPLQGDGGAGVVNNRKRFYHRVISLDDIRLIKNVMNTTLNDVLLGVTQAALSRYLNRRFGETNTNDGTSKPELNNLPSNIRLRSAVAINLRSDIGIQPLADMMAKGSRCKWGNYVSSAFIPLAIGLETDPLVYVLKAKSMMDRKKHSFQAALAYKLTGFILKTLGAKVVEAMSKQILLNTTTIVSNIVGPVEEVSFHGHPIAYIALSAYSCPQALLIHFISYAEKIVVSIAVDPTVIPDPHNLFDDMEESLKAMKVAVGERGLRESIH